MRILNVNTTLDLVNGGGMADRNFHMCKAFSNSGIACSVLILDIGLNPEHISKLKDVEVIALPCLVKRLYFPLFYPKKIKRLIKKVDVIHLMGHWTFINALVYFYARRMKKHYVFCPAGAFIVYGRSKLLKHLYNVFIGNKIIRNASVSIATTQKEKDLFVDAGIDEEKITIIPNGIDPTLFLGKDDERFREKYQIGEYPFILFVGRLNSIKGPDLLLKAFLKIKDEFPNIKLVIAGPDDGMYNELYEFVNSSGLKDRVVFIGHIADDVKSMAYNAADLVVIPSRSDVMSIVSLEAGASETPVLITEECGFSEIENIGGGKVVSATVESIGGGLREMLKNINTLPLMGKKLQKYVIDNYSWDSIVSKYIDMYEELV
ncbi:MAG: glycosyltransferase [Candidatus Ancaeobacter aquaticus]|nr:glycosyltransferase [Candidatus Ancaeobacter aquaticus]